jgi:integrase/recombinase XerD
MHKQYNSIYGCHIKRFVEMKRKLGFKFVTNVVHLYQLDCLAERNGETEPGITRELAEKWSKKRPNESEKYNYYRVRALAQFSLYLRDLGIDSFVPKLPRFPNGTFVPYIYSRKEVEAILKTSDRLRLDKPWMTSSIFSVPTLLRLLYGTGLRINEALDLKEDDINLDERFLRVKDSKNGKQRIIPMSDSLVAVCKQYVKHKKKLPLADKIPKYFFVRLNGRRCSYNSVSHWFKECLSRAGIQCIGRNHNPRIHDLRHTFAVNSLANLADAGVDLYASLPVLSAYLGHQTLEATNHYVRLTANMYPDLIRQVDMICLDVFPKLKNYETD